MLGEARTEFRVDLESRSDAAGIARDFIEAHSDSLPVGVIEDAKLLVSELVTNAVQHGRPAISLSVNLDPPLIGVAVHDEGADVPSRSAPAVPASSSTEGRGLVIVDRLSTSWGVVPDVSPPGKTVWFRLDDES